MTRTWDEIGTDSAQAASSSERGIPDASTPGCNTREGGWFGVKLAFTELTCAYACSTDWAGLIR